MQPCTPRVNILKRHHLELEYTTNILVIAIMRLSMWKSEAKKLCCQ